jgi:antitoxin MazE
MKDREQRWGNSLALRLPKHVAMEVQLRENCDVDLHVRNGAIVVRPASRQQYSLEELLGGVKKSNLHDEVEWGPPVGKEAW